RAAEGRADADVEAVAVNKSAARVDGHVARLEVLQEISLVGQGPQDAAVEYDMPGAVSHFDKTGCEDAARPRRAFEIQGSRAGKAQEYPCSSIVGDQPAIPHGNNSGATGTHPKPPARMRERGNGAGNIKGSRSSTL